MAELGHELGSSTVLLTHSVMQAPSCACTQNIAQNVVTYRQQGNVLCQVQCLVLRNEEMRTTKVLQSIKGPLFGGVWK